MLIFVVFGVLAILIYTAWATRARRSHDFYVAGVVVKPVWNGMAIAADWMSAASVISMTGAIAFLGYDGLPYIMGWTGGYVLLALVIAPYLRKFGKYTPADFIGDRYHSEGAKTLAVICSIIISFVYCIGQVAGSGVVLSRVFGIPFDLAVYAGAAVVVLSVVMGGMKGTTWTQCTQYIVVILGFTLPVMFIGWKLYGNPFPQFAYGELLQKIVSRETELGIAPNFIDPFTKTSRADVWTLTLVLMVGTAGLPHIMMRFFTTPTVSIARYSAGWALIFIGLLYLTAPAYAAFQRHLLLTGIAGRPFAELPAWINAWSASGLLKITDLNADGIVQFSEIVMHRDIAVLSLPELAGLPSILLALAAAAGLVAAVSTADGLLMVISSALSEDLYYKIINPAASEKGRLWLRKMLVIFFAVFAGWLAAKNLGYIVQIVSWAFSLAAATFFPAILLGITFAWVNRNGAVAGMLGGLVVTLWYILGVRFGWPYFVTPIAGIGDHAAGLFGMIVNVVLCVIVSVLKPLKGQDSVDAAAHIHQ